MHLSLDESQHIVDTLLDALGDIATRGDAADYIRRKKLEAVRDELSRRIVGERDSYEADADAQAEAERQQIIDEHPELGPNPTDEEILAARERDLKEKGEGGDAMRPEPGQQAAELEKEFYARGEEMSQLEQEWDDKIKDYVAEKYPTQATVTAETNSPAGKAERAAMLADPEYKRLLDEQRRALDEAKKKEDDAYKAWQEALKEEGIPNETGVDDSFFERGEDEYVPFRFAEDKEDFDRMRDEAVAKNGIVMPGLAEKEVTVVDVPSHDFDGEKPIEQANKWAKENIAKEHTTTDSSGATITYKISNRAIGKFLSDSAVKKSSDLRVHLSVLKKLPDVISESIEAEVHPDYRRGEDNKRQSEKGYEDSTLIHRYYGAASINGKIYRVKTTIKEFRDNQSNTPHSYEVTEIELVDSSTTNQSSEPTAVTHIGTAKLLQGVEKSYDLGKKLLDESEKTTESENKSNVQGLESYSEDELRSLVADHVERVIADSDMDAEVTDIRLIGSRTTGSAREDSDLDVLVEYHGSTREDSLFNALNGGEPLMIDGITVDINPITPGKSGSIDEFLKRNEGYGSRKGAQLKIIEESNPMVDDYHTGIRSVEDIKTLGEAVEESRREGENGGWDTLSSYPDVTNEMLENALRDGKIKVYSSKPIENGVFVTPSRIQAEDYAGGRGKKIYEKEVPIDDVAWINTDEGQYAAIRNAESDGEGDTGVAEGGLPEKNVNNVIVDSTKTKLPTNRKEAIATVAAINRPFINKDQNKEILVSNTAVKHAATQDKEHNFVDVRCMGIIDKIIENAVKIGEIPVKENEKGHTHKVEVYYCPVNIDGTQHSARLIVKQYENRGFVLDDFQLYDLGTKQEKTGNQTQGTGTNALTPLQLPVSRYKVKDLIHSTQELDKKIIGIGSDETTLFRTSEELNDQYPTWLSGQTTDSGQHTTQITSTVKSYNRIGEWMKNSGRQGATVLDASSGLGVGTQALRDMGFKVDDVEPYPSKDRKAPTYSKYEDIDKEYDVVISNAVLNVIPDDWRADVLKSMADKLKVGGKLIINVRDANSISKQKQKIELDSPSEILVTDKNGNIRAYQKGFTKKELQDWVKSELGEGWEVEIANEKNSGLAHGIGVVVTRGEGAEPVRYRTFEPVGEHGVKKVTEVKAPETQEIKGYDGEVRTYQSKPGEYKVEGMTDTFGSVEEAADAVRRRNPDYCVYIGADGNVHMHAWSELLPNGIKPNTYAKIIALSGGELSNAMKKRIAQYTEREMNEARKKAEALTQELGLDVEFHDDPSEFSGRKAKAKGWYDPKTGKIHVVMGNHSGVSDVMATMLHEGVAHHGLRKLFGEDFNTFLDNVYSNVDKDITTAIDEKMAKLRAADEREGVEHSDDYYRRAATEEYLAELSEDGLYNAEKHSSLAVKAWQYIKESFINMLRRAGFSMELTDDELRYTLWKSHENLRQTAVEMAKDAVLKDKAGIKEYVEDGEPVKSVAEGYEPVARSTDGQSTDGVIGEGDVRYNNKKSQPNELQKAGLNHLSSQTADVAKLGQKTEFAKNGLKKVLTKYKGVKKPKGFLTDLSIELGLDLDNRGSHYGDFVDANGNVFSIRVANHNADASNYKEHGNPEINNIGIVIKSRRKKNTFKPDKDVKAQEYVYLKEDIAKADGDVLSQIAESLAELFETGEYTDKTGLAKVNVSPEIQTITKNFKNWFGDWENEPENASKVVDEDGRPKVVLHGTPNNVFHVFDPEKSGSSTDAGWLGKGFYFFGNAPDYARQYAGRNGRVLEVYLDIKNPYYANDEDMNRLAEANDPKLSEQFRQELEDEGYDGVYYNGDLNEEWVAFHPEQIKSATENNGDFSRENPDIRFRDPSRTVDDINRELREVYRRIGAEGYDAVRDDIVRLRAERDAIHNGGTRKEEGGTGAAAESGGAGGGVPPSGGEPPTPTPEPQPEPLPPTGYDRPRTAIEQAQAVAMKVVSDTKASLEERNSARRELDASLKSLHKAMRLS